MKNLFKSATSYELLKLFVASEGKEFYLTELASLLAKDAANVTRELARLEKEGLVAVRKEGKKKYYRLNPEYPSLRAVRELFKDRAASEEVIAAGTWMLAEDIPNMDPFFSQIWLNSFVSELGNTIGRAYKRIASIHRDYHQWFYFEEQDAQDIGEHIVDLFESDPTFMRTVNRNIVKHSDMLRAFAKTLPQEGLQKLIAKKLIDLYKEHEKLHTDYYMWAWIPVAADMFSNSLTLRGKSILRKKGVSEDDMNEWLTLLTEPRRPSLIKVEQDSLCRIGIAIEKDQKQLLLAKELGRLFREEEVGQFGLATHGMALEKKFKEAVEKQSAKLSSSVQRAAQKHFLEYFYTKFLFTEEQGVYSIDHYYRELMRLVNSDEHLENTMRSTERETEKKLREQQELVKKLGLTQSERVFFEEWGEFMVTKIYRRFAQIFAVYRMLSIIEEIAKRIGLSVKQTKFMTTEEIERALLHGIVDREAVTKRVSLSVYFADKASREWLTGLRAEKAVAHLQKETRGEVGEIAGQCGCRGSATGTVRVVNVTADMKKMNQGDILVAICTQPDLLPAMKKAAAFVTDQGGVTSHAAIVARELQTPCVIGTKIASKVLKDGDTVEVDANKGIVKILKRSEKRS